MSIAESSSRAQIRSTSVAELPKTLDKANSAVKTRKIGRQDCGITSSSPAWIAKLPAEEMSLA